jgi:nitrate/TMAO reductase-like tetraheme cytochrome c subunit
MQQSPDDTRGPASRRTLWSQPASRWLLGVPIGGLLMLVLGIVLANGFAFAMHATSSPEFCGNACHYMRDFVAPEVASSVHGRNPSGVAATCPDCHVPKPFFAKAQRKIEAVREGWGHLRGVIETRDKFEAHRHRMAERVWASMKATDSRECRSCHDFATMALESQDRSAARKHQAAAEKGDTCIDCHKGVAHALPAGMESEDDATPDAAALSAGGAGNRG